MNLKMRDLGTSENTKHFKENYPIIALLHEFNIKILDGITAVTAIYRAKI